MTVLSSKSFTDVNSKTRREKGPLVKVQIAPGQYVKMYRADAVAAGHLPGEKSHPPAENKLRLPAEDKLREAATSPPTPLPKAERGAEGDDLTAIPGVGLATARLLASRGITTFAQLRAANLSFLGVAARTAVEKWKSTEA